MIRDALAVFREIGGKLSLTRFLVIAIVVVVLCRDKWMLADVLAVVGSLCALAYHRGKEHD